jgi:hypothetical protein
MARGLLDTVDGGDLMDTTVSSEWTWALYGLGALGSLLLLLALLVLAKNRHVRQGEVFVASRWTRGNRLFPTQVAITPTSVIQRKPQWLGRREESIHISHVASVKIDTGILFADVIIETSGGSEPIHCHGHSKRDAQRMKLLIEQYQTLPAQVLAAPAGLAEPGTLRHCPFCAETIMSAAVICRYCNRPLSKTA